METEVEVKPDQPKNGLEWQSWIGTACWCSGAAILALIVISQVKLMRTPAPVTHGPLPKTGMVEFSPYSVPVTPAATATGTDPFAVARADTRPKDGQDRSTSSIPALMAVSSKQPAVPQASMFVEVQGPAGMKAYNNGRTMIYVKGGKLVATIGLGSSQSTAEPPAGTALYRTDGTIAGWVGPAGSKPTSIIPNTPSAGGQCRGTDHSRANRQKTASTTAGSDVPPKSVRITSGGGNSTSGNRAQFSSIAGSGISPAISVCAPSEGTEEIAPQILARSR